MCGIAGFVDFSDSSNHEVLNKMVSLLSHRGPDDIGAELYQNTSCSVGFAQARLSILDVSRLGHQPMHYEQLSIVFNGEIYNFKTIREELVSLGYTFGTQSDTEVILKAYKQWGTEAVHKFIGMFAIVLFNRDNQEIVVIRDRTGVKPLYYYWDGNTFLFASEIKALHVHPSFQKIIDNAALRSFFHYGYVPGPETIFDNCKKLDSASILTLSLKHQSFSIQKYWNLAEFYLKPKLNVGYEEAKAHLHDLLKSAFMYRMVSDVPVGVFLSGGYDSTAVTAIIQAQSSSPLKTFTIGFHDGNNEAPFAKETAKWLKTDHHELYCTQKESQEIIMDLPYYFDEPFADSSGIPTVLVSRFAKQFVTVALSADGGDEIFGGYQYYQKIIKNNKLLNIIPHHLKPFTKEFIRRFAGLPFFSERLRLKLETVSSALNEDLVVQAAAMHASMVGAPAEFERDIFSKSNGGTLVHKNFGMKDFDDAIDYVMCLDYQRYLQDDILVKVDRATMSCSLEGREPFLDQRIVEFVAQLPTRFKLQAGYQKQILKDIVHEYVPKEMMDRPKTGFSIPINKWLKSDLSFLLEEHLSRAAIAKSGLFNIDYVISIVERFKKGNLHHVAFIWKMLVFQMWYKRWM
jgi:asparagine synthase (glutamine-hydrolysing)